MTSRSLKFVLISFFVLFSFKSMGQSYTPFPDSNAVWKVVFETYPPVPMPTYEFHFDQYILGDTLINSILYKKLYELYYDPDCSLNTYGPYYIGCFRNEIPEKKVYFIKKTQTEELLLYDFSLNIGDTVPQTHINYSYPHLVVENIDSVIVGSSYRKRFTYLQETYPPVFAIEGIGAHTGLLEPMEIFEQQHLLRCFTLENELLYINADSCNLETDTCISVSISDHAPDAIDVFIYPNPVGYYVNIRYSILRQAQDRPSDIRYTILIFDTFGRLMDEIIVPRSQGETQIEISDYPDGVYIAVLRDDKKVLGRKKFVVVRE